MCAVLGIEPRAPCVPGKCSHRAPAQPGILLNSDFEDLPCFESAPGPLPCTEQDRVDTVKHYQGLSKVLRVPE